MVHQRQVLSRVAFLERIDDVTRTSISTFGDCNNALDNLPGGPSGASWASYSHLVTSLVWEFWGFQKSVLWHLPNKDTGVYADTSSNYTVEPFYVCILKCRFNHLPCYSVISLPYCAIFDLIRKWQTLWPKNVYFSKRLPGEYWAVPTSRFAPEDSEHQPTVSWIDMLSIYTIDKAEQFNREHSYPVWKGC